MDTWMCGDCGRQVPESEGFCRREFDDYLSLRGGSVESAISRAVEKAIEPLVKRATDRLNGVTYWRVANVHHWRWTS